MAVEFKDDLFDSYDLVEQFSGFAVNRGDLIAINGKTIHELMFEEFKETNKESDLGEFYQWYQDNLAEKTKDYVMDAYRNNTYVEMFMVDDTGKLMPKANRIRFNEFKVKEAQAAEQTQQPKQDFSETTESLDDNNTMDAGKASAAPQLDEEKIRAARADIRSTNQKAQEAMKNIPLSERKKGFDNEAVKFQSQYPNDLASLTDELRNADRFLLTGSDQYKHMQESLKTMSDLMQKLGNPPTKEQVKALQTASADLSSKVDTYWNYKDADNTTKKRSDREKRRIAAAKAVKEWCSELQKSVKTLDKGYAFFAPEMEAQRAAETKEAEQRATAQEPTRETFHQKTDNYMERHYGVNAGNEYKEDWLTLPVKMKDPKKKPRYVGVMQHLGGRIKVDRNYLSDYMYDLTQKQKQGEFETINLDEPTEKEKTLAEQQEIRKDKCKDMVARMVAVEMIANERRATFKKTGSFKNDENSLEVEYAKDPNAFLKGVKDIPRVRDILEDMSLDTMRNFLNQNEAKSIADDFAKQAQAEREAQKKAREKAALEEAERQKAAREREEAEKRWAEAPLEERLVGREAFEERNVSKPEERKYEEAIFGQVVSNMEDFKYEYSSIGNFDDRIKNTSEYSGVCMHIHAETINAFLIGHLQDREQFNPSEKEKAKNILAGLVAHNLVVQQKERYQPGDKLSPAEQFINEQGMYAFFNRVKESEQFQKAVENLDGETFGRMVTNESYKTISYNMLEAAKNTRQKQFSNENKKEQGAVMQ